MKKKYLFGLLSAAVLAGGTMFALNAGFGDQVKVDNPVVAEGETTDEVVDETIYAPGPVTDVSYTVSEVSAENTADVTITFTTPTNHSANNYASVFEDGLNELTLIEVVAYTASTYSYDTVVAKLENPTIGETYTVTIEDAPLGLNKYKIFTYNSANYELSIAGGNTWGYNEAVVELAIQVGPYPPGKVTNATCVSGVPNADGTGNVTISFKAPTNHFTDSYGYTFADGLDELSLIEVTTYNSATEMDEVVWKVENPTVGGDYSFTLENQPGGYINYRIVAYNSANIAYAKSQESPKSGSYYSSVSVSTFVGYDAPSSVQNLVAEYDGEKVVLTWEPPVEGTNGGTVDFSSVVYDVVRVDSKSWTETPLATEIAECTFTDEISFEQPTMIHYSIKPKSMVGTELKEGRTTSSAKIVVGTPISLPFKESFTGGQESYLWSNSYQSYGINTSWSISDLSTGGYGSSTPLKDAEGQMIKLSDSYDLDGGCLTFSSYGYYNGDATYASSPISLEGSVNPVLSFYAYKIYNAENHASVKIIVTPQGGEPVVVETIDDYTDTSKTTGWEKYEISLKDYISDKPVTFEFSLVTEKQKLYAAFDKIQIKDVYDNDLLVSSISAPKQAESGETFDVTATVECNGNNTAEGFAVVLYRDGEEVDRITEMEVEVEPETPAEGETETPAEGEETTEPAEPVYEKITNVLNAEESYTFTFKVTAHNSFSDETKFQVAVVYEADECVGNDLSKEAVTTIVKAAVPAVPAVTASYVEPNKVTLSWEAPDYVLPEPETITDGFEDYDDWAPYDSTTETMGTAIGDWIVINSNNCYKGTLLDKGNDYYTNNGQTAYPGAYSSPAYQVINTETLGVSEDYTGYWETYNGNKCLVSPDQQSYYNRKSDWLISPKLSGKAQTVTFFAQTYSGNAQQIMVYGSATGNSMEDFTTVLLGSLDEWGSEYGYNVSQVAVGETYNSEFNEIEVEVPEGIKYIAVKAFTGYYASGSFLIIDDFTYEAAVPGIPVELVGYNVYCDGVKVNEEVLTETTYEAAIEYGATHTYSVEAVYDLGVSEQVSAEAVSAPALELPAATLSGEGAESVVTLAWSAPAVSEGAAPVAVQKYVVYRNGEQLAETTEATYQDTLADYGQYTYTVKVVYDKGESELSNEFAYEYLEVVLPAVAIIGNIADNLVTLMWETPVVPDGKAPVTLEKYVVYCNGEQLAETTETRGTIELGQDGEYKFHVVVVYDKGESEASNEYVVSYSGVDSVVANAKVAVKDQTIVLNGVEGVNVMVASTDGKVVYSGVGTDVVEVPVVAGVYLVKIGKATTKVIVK